MNERQLIQYDVARRKALERKYTLSEWERNRFMEIVDVIQPWYRDIYTIKNKMSYYIPIDEIDKYLEMLYRDKLIKKRKFFGDYYYRINPKVLFKKGKKKNGI